MKDVIIYDMTLKEKLNEQLSEAFANEIEQLAEDFAVGFANWLQVDVIIDLIENHTTRELLEIYKKEVGV